MTAPIGVALIGSGNFARDQHLPAILACPLLSLKAVYSRTLSSAARLCEGLDQKIDWYSDETTDQSRGIDDMLSNSNIKAVIIVLPILALPDFIKKALQAGKHVLSEKPVGKDIETAQDLIAWTYRDVDLNRTTWSVAENYRFFESHTYAAAEVQKLGRVLGWRVRINDNMEVGSKSYGEPSQAKLELLKLRWIAKGLISESETPWRKTPEYQGGFILDAGVHFVATLRYLLGRNNALSHLAAFTVQLRDDLPPVDTVNATLRSKTGVSDTFTISMATTFKGSGYIISCEKGTVTVFFDDDRVVVTRGSEESTQSFPNQGKGVKQEVAVWAEGLSTGTQDDRLSPKQALSDLEVIEMLLQSGKKDGASVELLLQ